MTLLHHRTHTHTQGKDCCHLSVSPSATKTQQLELLQPLSRQMLLSSGRKWTEDTKTETRNRSHCCKASRNTRPCACVACGHNTGRSRRSTHQLNTSALLSGEHKVRPVAQWRPWRRLLEGFPSVLLCEGQTARVSLLIVHRCSVGRPPVCTFNRRHQPAGGCRRKISH